MAVFHYTSFDLATLADVKRITQISPYLSLFNETHPFVPFKRLHLLLRGKAVFGVVMLLLCSGIMLGGGGLIFGIHWQQPWRC